MIPKDYVKKAVFDQENGVLLIIFKDNSIRMLELCKSNDYEGELWFK